MAYDLDLLDMSEWRVVKMARVMRRALRMTRLWRWASILTYKIIILMNPLVDWVVVKCDVGNGSLGVERTPSFMMTGRIINHMCHRSPLSSRGAQTQHPSIPFSS